MGEWIPLTPPEGPVRAWLARPDSAPLGAVVVVQEIFGVNPHIRAVTDRFARPDTELRYDESGVSHGRDYVAQLGFERTLKVVGAAARWLRESGHNVAAVRFCWHAMG
jgi:carboxymethylenebutenolidase